MKLWIWRIEAKNLVAMETNLNQREVEQVSSSSKRQRISEDLSEEIPSPSRQPVDPKVKGAKRLIVEGYQVAGNDLVLHPEVSQPTMATPNLTAFPRSPSGKFKAVFLGVNDLKIFAYVAEVTSAAMDRKKQEGEVKGQNAQRFYTKAVTAEEILAILGLQILFRGRGNISSIEDQFKELPPRLTRWPISLKRYKAIVSSMDADMDVLSDLLRDSWKNAINPGTEFAIDESLFSYHSRSDPSSPQRFIPRKPHPNGLLSYMAGFKTEHGPYIFDLEPDHQPQALNARAAMQRIVQRWSWRAIIPHVVVDAGFSGEMPLAIVGDFGAKITAGLNTAHFKFLHDQLMLHCPPKSWIALKDKAGVIWSLFRSGESEHFLASTGFTNGIPVIREEILEDQQVQQLAKIGIRGLVQMADVMGVKIEGDAFALATAIAKRINADAPNGKPGPSATHQQQVGPMTSSGSASPATSIQDLQKLNVDALKEICKDLGLRYSGKLKGELVQEIFEAKKVSQQQTSQFLTALQQSSSKESPPHLTKYREVFNAIDIHDKKWYKLQNHHAVTKWKPKFIFALLGSGVVNSHILYSHFQKEKFLFFIEELAYQLCDQ